MHDIARVVPRIVENSSGGAVRRSLGLRGILRKGIQIVIILLFNSVLAKPEAAYLYRLDIVTAERSFPVAVEVTFPKYQYEEKAGSIKEVDFRNFRYHLLSESVGLRNGSAHEYRQTEGIHLELSLRRIWYFDSQNEGPGYALVYLDFFSVGASSSDDGFVLLFTMENGQPVIIQQFDFDRQAPETGVHFNPERKELTIKARARDGSAHCCPENLEIDTFGWQGTAFKLAKRRITPLTSSERCCPENL